MSKENVDVVRRLFEAANSGDAEAVLSLYHPDVEFDITRSPLPRLVGGGRTVYRGHDGLRAFFRERSEQMPEIVDSCEELMEAGDQVISVVSSRGRGRTSGIEVQGPRYAALWTIRDGKIMRVVWLATREDAIEAAGRSQ